MIIRKIVSYKSRSLIFLVDKFLIRFLLYIIGFLPGLRSSTGGSIHLNGWRFRVTGRLELSNLLFLIPITLLLLFLCWAFTNYWLLSRSFYTFLIHLNILVTIVIAIFIRINLTYLITISFIYYTLRIFIVVLFVLVFH